MPPSTFRLSRTSRALRYLLLLLPAAPAAVAQSDTTLNVRPDTTAADADRRAAAYTISGSELDNEIADQNVSGVLQSSRDIFNSTAGFTFGAARFRIRGFDGENTLISLNGVLANDLETGYASFTNWGGLNDVTRWVDTRTGITASRYNFGSIGGFTDMSLRAGELRKGFRFSYALTNRAYSNRIMATYNTGMMANGWAFSVSGSRRWATEGYVPGTFYDAGAYFLGVEKRINKRHSIAFTGLGAPIMQGKQGLAVHEAVVLADDHYYNPYWGYQNGEKRNARVSFDHKPIFLLSHTYTPNDSTEWTTSVMYSFGRDGNTNLNWNDAKDPRPDYYRYLPSYYQFSNPGVSEDLRQEWLNGDRSQINWDALYFANSKNLYSVVDANGITGNTVTGLRSKYVVEDWRTDPTRIAINSVWSRELKNGRHLTVGGSWNKQKTHNYKVMQDLLGGDFWLDLNQFADLDPTGPSGAQNNLEQPNHVVRVGDTYGYDFDIHTQLFNVFGQLEMKGPKLEGYAGVSLSQTSFWRESRFVSGLYPNEPKLGETHSFLHAGVKAGAVYKINGRHYLAVNGAFISRPPSPRSAYVNPRNRNTVIDNLMNEEALAFDASYLLRLPRLKGRLTGYYANIKDQIWSRTFFNEDLNSFGNYLMSGVAQTHMGLELGIEAKLTSTWQANIVLAEGSYLYTSRPSATVTVDNLGTTVFTGRKVYWENYRVGGMPQSASSLGLQYNSPKFWRAGANLNWFRDIYIDPSPDRRTAEAVEGLVTDDPQWGKLLNQEKLDNGVTVDVFFYKSWQYKRKYRIGFNLSVNNVLDNQDLRTGGYEQLRYDSLNPDKFPTKYGYMFGRTFFAMLTFSF